MVAESLPPSLLELTTYVLSLSGKAARGRLAERLADRDLRLSHMAVLASLADFGPQVQRGLSEQLSVHPSDMAKVVDELVRRDLVTRTPDADDRRRTVIDLTGRGRRELGQLLAEAVDVQRELLEPLTAAELRTLHKIVLKLFPDGRPPSLRGR